LLSLFILIDSSQNRTVSTESSDSQPCMCLFDEYSTVNVWLRMQLVQFNHFAAQLPVTWCS